MRIVLKEELFTNDYYVQYFNSNKSKATFRIVDEEFMGVNSLGIISRVVITIAQYDSSGVETDTYLGTSVIGIGDGTIGILTDTPELRGKVLNRDNMSSCTVELYETE